VQIRGIYPPAAYKSGGHVSLCAFVPIKSCAATNYVITTKEFQRESKAVASEIKIYYNKYVEKNSTCDVEIFASSDEFVQIWNRISAKKDIGIIVVNSHGNPFYCGIDKAGMSKIKTITCDYLLLLDCFTDHVPDTYQIVIL